MPANILIPDKQTQNSRIQQQKANALANKASSWAQSASGMTRFKTSTSMQQRHEKLSASVLHNKPAKPKTMIQQTLKARGVKAPTVSEQDSCRHDDSHEAGEESDADGMSVHDTRDGKNSSAEANGYYPLEPLDNDEGAQSARVEKVLREIEEERMRYVNT